MALKATIHKALLHIADLDRSYYGDHSLTLARHPSETDERLMVRLLAFALHADEALAFGRGISTDDEPDLWRKDLTGAIELWIETGLPDEKRLRRACGRAPEVIVYSYGGRTADVWWRQNAAKLEELDNLAVIDLPDTRSLTALAARNMDLQCTVQDGQILLTSEGGAINLEPRIRKPRG